MSTLTIPALLTAATSPRYRRWRRLIGGLLITLLGGFLLVTALAAFVYLYGEALRDPLPAAHSADAIIVLGGGTYRNGQPDRAQARRVQHAVDLYQRGVASYLLCTGALDRPNYAKSEAQACVDQAVAAGVPSGAILREDRSANTEQNLINAQQVLAANQLHSAVIVSDSYHLFRAQRLVAHYGLNITAYSPAQATQGTLSPGEALWSSYREVGAMLWDTIRIVQGH